MNNEVVILIAEDDEGHAGLIRKNLQRAGIVNPLIHFKNGQEVLDFLFRKPGPSPKGAGGGGREPGTAYILLLDIRMPKLDGAEVLEAIKTDAELCKLPVIMITTTSDPREVEKCHRLGCNNYITKPVDYEAFVQAIRQLGLFLSVVQVPVINGEHKA